MERAVWEMEKALGVALNMAPINGLNKLCKELMERMGFKLVWKI